MGAPSSWFEDIRSFNEVCSIITRAVMLLKQTQNTTDEIKPIEIAKPGWLL